MPFAALYVVEVTFSRGFESYLRSQIFDSLGFVALSLRSIRMEGKLRDLDTRGSHLIVTMSP